jgi:hypothetical protein
MVIAALASFALLLIAWIVAPSGETQVVAARKAPPAEVEPQPAMAKAA